MPLLQEKDRAAVRDELDAAIQRPVQLALFVSADDCPYCDVVRELLTEISALHADLTVAEYDLHADAGRAAALGVDKAPAIVVLGGAEQTDYGIRFYGVPSGYEFASLLEAIRTVGSDTAELQPATRGFLEELTQPLHLQVFVTPTCPYCPRAVVLAQRLAYASPLVSADMVEVTEFPELGDRYGVMGVPRTVINETAFIEGAAPENMVLAKLREAAPLAA
jgi:glutaredoxin-like protein